MIGLSDDLVMGRRENMYIVIVLRRNFLERCVFSICIALIGELFGFTGSLISLKFTSTWSTEKFRTLRSEFMLAVYNPKQRLAHIYESLRLNKQPKVPQLSPICLI